MKLIAELTIEGVPVLPNKNRYAHWTTKRKEIIKWGGLVISACNKAKIADLNLSQAKITLTRHSSKECDYDNLVTSFKGLQDGLVKARVIVDDKPSVIGIPTYQWLYRPRKEGGMVTIKIEKPE